VIEAKLSSARTFGRFRCYLGALDPHRHANVGFLQWRRVVPKHFGDGRGSDFVVARYHSDTNASTVALFNGFYSLLVWEIE
jgi:hypothetical protein